MGTEGTMVVRYVEPVRTAAERSLRSLVRRQGVLLLILGTLLGVLVVVPLGFAATAGRGVDAVFVLVAIVLLIVPIAVVSLGVRQLRRQVELPVVAVTISAGAVHFPTIDRPSVLAPRIRAEEWARAETSGRIVPGSGIRAARVEFTWQRGGKRRSRFIAAENLDVDPRTIVDALSVSSPLS